MNDDRDDNVIHVSFGRDGTYERRPAPAPVEPTAEQLAAGHELPTKDPLAALYSVGDVAKLFSLKESQLRYWMSVEFIAPSAKVGSRRYYAFQDLIGIRAAKALLEQGVPLREVRRSVDALRQSLPKVVRPLAELRVVADGQTVVVQDEDGSFEPTTGQGVLDFRVEALKDDVVRVLRPPSNDGDRRTAYELYLEGCRLDEEEATYDLAERAYRSSLKLDPSLANALTNLGNLCYRRDRVEEAEGHYRKALEVDAEQPEALYNLGFIRFEEGDPGDAVEYFEAALKSDAAFADAHFNLAMAYEELDEAGRARPHWETYLVLEPEGDWAAVALRHLDAAKS